MARWGSCDFSQLKAFQKKLEKLEKDQDVFLSSCAKELAARLLAKVIKRTPVVTGALRRGWTAGKENVNEKGNVIGVSGKKGYAAGMRVTKRGDTYTIVVFNSLFYASYVEYGHRQTPGRFVPAIGKRLKKGWAPGKFMLTTSEMELREQAAGILERKLKKRLEECFRG